MRRLLALLVVTIVLGIAQGANAGPFEDGVTVHNGKDYATALSLWKPLAAQGDAKAQTNLGVMHERGQGVTQDYKEAARWFGLGSVPNHGFVILYSRE